MADATAEVLVKLDLGPQTPRKEREDAMPTTPEVPKVAKKPELDNETADFAIVCEGRCYTTHKNILKKASPYFERMFRFKGAEANEDKLELYDVDKDLMKHVLDYMYTNTYALPGGTAVSKTGYCNHTNAALRGGLSKGAVIFKRKCACNGKILDPSHLLQHVRLYALADYFDMRELKAFARQGTLDVLHVHWDDQDLELADALEEAFNTTPDDDRGIRDPLVNILQEHPGLWVDEGEVQEWLDDNPEVSEEVNGDWDVAKFEGPIVPCPHNRWRRD